MGHPTEGSCHVITAWHIQRGDYNNTTTNLDRLNVAAVFNTLGNMATGPKWKGVLYL
jgi:hypothetical protein